MDILGQLSIQVDPEVERPLTGDGRREVSGTSTVVQGLSLLHRDYIRAPTSKVLFTSMSFGLTRNVDHS